MINSGSCIENTERQSDVPDELKEEAKAFAIGNFKISLNLLTLLTKHLCFTDDWMKFALDLEEALRNNPALAGLEKL